MASESERQINTDQGCRFLPIDKGWAWVIAFSAFMNMTITVGYNRSLSVLFVDIGQAYQESNKVVSLMFTLHALSGSVLSLLVANIFMKKFNVRSITVISAVVNALASVVVSFAPNTVVFLLLFLVKGIAFGGLLVCPMSLIGYYFQKRRALASALANAGFCVGYIVFPPLTELLRSHYGLQGTLLIMSGLDFHLVAINMLLRPVESYKKLKICKNEFDEKTKTPIYKGPKDLAEPLIKHLTGDLSANVLIYNVQDSIEEIVDNSLDKTVKLKDGKDMNTPIYQFDVTASVILPTKIIDGTIKQVNENPKQDQTISQDTRISNGLESTNRVVAMNLGDSRASHDCPVIPETETCSSETSKAYYTSQLSIVSYGDVPCVIATEIVKDENTQLKCELSSFLDLTLFKSWLFRMMALFTCCGIFTNYLSIYWPIIAVTSGINKSDAALLMALSGVMDLSSRIITGFAGDFKFVSKTKMVAFSLFILSLVCFCSKLFNTYPLFVLFALLVGTFSGFRQNFSNTLLLDYFGADNLAKANGITLTIATLVLSVNHPVLGALLDATGSFVIPLYYVGTMMLVATIIILLEPLAKRLDERKRLRKQTNNDVDKI